LDRVITLLRTYVIGETCSAVPAGSQERREELERFDADGHTLTARSHPSPWPTPYTRSIATYGEKIFLLGSRLGTESISRVDTSFNLLDQRSFSRAYFGDSSIDLSGNLYAISGSGDFSYLQMRDQNLEKQWEKQLRCSAPQMARGADGGLSIAGIKYYRFPQGVIKKNLVLEVLNPWP
jgi:hypothetical protein